MCYFSFPSPWYDPYSIQSTVISWTYFSCLKNNVNQCTAVWLSRIQRKLRYHYETTQRIKIGVTYLEKKCAWLHATELSCQGIVSYKTLCMFFVCMWRIKLMKIPCVTWTQVLYQAQENLHRRKLLTILKSCGTKDNQVVRHKAIGDLVLLLCCSQKCLCYKYFNYIIIFNVSSWIFVTANPEFSVFWKLNFINCTESQIQNKSKALKWTIRNNYTKRYQCNTSNIFSF